MVRHTDTTDDLELVRRYQSGDTAACDALLARHRDRLFRLAVAWLYRPDEAEDAVQEVFARALRGLKAFRREAQPATWFYRTCRLVCHEHNRRRTHDPLPHEPPAASDGPEVLAERVELKRRLAAALADLTDAERDVVMLRNFEELSVRETAATLSVSEGAVKTLHFRARRKLGLQLTS
ncbi:MAG: sigma-70 family RNA polymerase sigma factor [Pseudomonadota bacterium]